jgi:transcriptional regulator with XRE-family HTH domain
MSSLAERLDAAIKASGKTADQIAQAAGVSRDTVSRIRTGAEDNPTLQVLMGIAREANTSVGALLGESIDISAEDEQELLRFRDWIDGKLTTIDARQEPNAVIVSQPSAVPASKVADRPRQPGFASNHPFGENVQLILRAVGDSMVGEGILPDDTLYAIAARDTASAVGRLVACRLDEAVFVKRLVTEHRRLFLRSAHPRYRAIRIDPKASSFQILGVVVGRTGRIS